MDRNRKVTLVGGVITAITVAVLYLLPALIPVQDVRMFVYRTTGDWMFGNPFVQLRLLGGIPGALVSGYFATDRFGNPGWEASIKTGIYATLLGITVFFAVFLLANVVIAIVVEGIFPPPLYTTGIVSFIFLFPMFLAYPFEGVLFGALGAALKKLYTDLL